MPTWRTWDELEPDAKRQRHLLALAAAIFLIHYALLCFWFVEDSAITFAFARHAASGEGFVAWPGGERVEGFSNPTWTLLLAATDLVGVGPFTAAKLYGGAFGLICLVLADRWARYLLGDRDDLLPALAPLLLAFSPQFVIWNASGLENSLFNLLLAGGAVLLLGEADRQRVPWSALLWSLLAFTRPEGPIYPAVAGLVGLAAVLGRQGPRGAAWWAIRWAGLFLGPLLVWHTWRYLYFAWEFPNTYYAKLGTLERFQPFAWTRRGWRYLRQYALYTGQGVLIPVYLLGQTGLRGWRGVTGGVVALVLLILVIPGLGWLERLPLLSAVPDPSWLVHLRVVALAAALLLLPAVGLGRRGWAGRTLAWSQLGAALFFVLYSGGDWMNGYRLLAMASIPMAVLLADGIATVHDALRSIAPPQARGPRYLVGFLVVAPLFMGVVRTGVFLSFPETMPFDVHRQVQYKHKVKERLHLDYVSAMPVDMGAHLWWADFEVFDLPGLIDVPMAHHKWQKRFSREYVFQERKPTYAHVHGGWARRTRMDTHREWRHYLEIDPYPVSPSSQHTGNHIRRDLFIEKIPRKGNDLIARFGRQVELLDWNIPSPTVARGQGVYLEVAWKRGEERADFRALVFLAAHDHLAVLEVPPGYDWYLPEDWKRNDKVHGWHTLHLPDDLPVGRYEVGLVLLGTGEDGQVLHAERIGRGTTGGRPWLARGELRGLGTVEVVDEGRALEIADLELERALEHARLGECLEAEQTWAKARRHVLPTHPWQTVAGERIHTSVARCWALEAERAPKDDSVEAIRAARRWDHRQRDVIRVGRALADVWEEQGEAALVQADEEAAYSAWRDALYADPTRSWLRRRTEELRDRRLGLDLDQGLIPDGPEGGER